MGHPYHEISAVKAFSLYLLLAFDKRRQDKFYQLILKVRDSLLPTSTRTNKLLLSDVHCKMSLFLYRIRKRKTSWGTV